MELYKLLYKLFLNQILVLSVEDQTWSLHGLFIAKIDIRFNRLGWGKWTSVGQEEKKVNLPLLPNIKSSYYVTMNYERDMLFLREVIYYTHQSQYCEFFCLFVLKQGACTA